MQSAKIVLRKFGAIRYIIIIITDIFPFCGMFVERNEKITITRPGQV